MRAVVYEDSLSYRENHPEPDVPEDWALVNVKSAGICQTDIELTRGYMGFRGILGHEFIGRVERCSQGRWVGERVVAAINNGCGKCLRCREGLERHCDNRSVLGIHRQDGCMADFCTVPVHNLVAVPETIPDDSAVLIEPLAAACEILEQVAVTPEQRVVVLGDGRLGILCAWVLATAARKVLLVGRHDDKLAVAGWRQVRTARTLPEPRSADLVVEATGRSDGLADAIEICRPRGTLVLKSTLAARHTVNMAPVVVNELSLVGSRCGNFHDAMALVQQYGDMPLQRLITARFPIEAALDAFAAAGSGRHIKVLIDLPD